MTHISYPKYPLVTPQIGGMICRKCNKNMNLHKGIIQMTDEELTQQLRDQRGHKAYLAAADRIEQLKEKLDKAVNIATLALNALGEIQTYKSPIDPWEEDALAMRELNAFDFHVEFARADIAKLEEQHD